MIDRSCSCGYPMKRERFFCVCPDNIVPEEKS